MATNVPLWQWALSSVFLPVVIGLGGAWLGHSLSLRKSRHEARLSTHRATYETLMPALHSLVESAHRQIRLELHEFYDPEDEERERLASQQSHKRYASAMDCVRGTVARGELAASRRVLDALSEYLTVKAGLAEDWSMGNSDFLDIYERDLAASKTVLAKVESAVHGEI